MTKTWINSGTFVNVEHGQQTGIVDLVVDDKEISVSEGNTILEAVARMNGIGNIPTLCYHPAVKPYGACRLCTVEASEDGGSTFRFVVACLYPAKQGLIVRTNTPRIRSLRKGIIELLLARAPNVKVVQDLALEYGVDKPRFSLGDQDCVLCGLCVRACQEVIGKSAIGLVNRGIYREVAAPFYAYGVSSDCIGCGDCSYVCPTGAIKMGIDGKAVMPKVKIPYAEVEALMNRETASAQ